MKRDQILKLLADNRPASEIAERVGCSLRYVNMIRKGLNTPTPKPIDEVVDDDKEILRLKNVVSELNKKYKLALETSEFETRLLTLLKDRIEALPPAPYRPPTIEHSDVSAQEEYILFLSDAHAGEVVSSMCTLGLGGYDFDTFAYRVERIREALVVLHTKCLKRASSVLHVIFNGDIVSGEIHDELMQTNDAPVSLVVVETAYVLSQFLRELSTLFPIIEVTCVAASNHPRLTKKGPFKNKWDNWDYIVHKMMESYCANLKNVTFDIPKSLHVIKRINGKNYLILHGDNIQSWMGIPWYGINRMTAKLKNLYAPNGTVIDYVLLGHFHTPGSIADINGEIIINGSFKGADEFSIGKLGTATLPAQWYFGTDPQWGITARYMLQLAGSGKSNYKYDITT